MVAAVTVLLGLLAGSVVYTWRFRGNVRWDGFSEYLRKSWPIFAPLNCLLYLTTERRARGAMPRPQDFPELAALQANWRTIRDEALALHAAHGLDGTSRPDSPGYHDIGFRTFYKYGWRKFYLSWYGYRHDSARRLCPRTSALLAAMPSVSGAMFTLLPAGSALTRHADPVACSLRYHLGLVTPESDECFIDVDGHRHAWRDGQVLIFDETYPHYARNDSGTDRLILMCDVDRPVNLLGRLVNAPYRLLMRLTVVPNTDEDRRGFANRVFAACTPLLARSRTLKQRRPAAYRTLKYGVNTLLLALLCAPLLGLLLVAAAIIQ